MSLVLAHRGARSEAPENTLPAFHLAVQQGADGIEFDVQLTADGHVVVIHDETLDRTTSGSGPVVGHSLEELQRLDASTGMPGFAGVAVPTLTEVLRLLAPTGVRLNIELKDSLVAYPGLPDRVLAAVEAFGLADRVVLSTFNHCTLRALRDRAVPLELGMLYTDPLYHPWRYAATLGVAALHPPAHLTSPELVAESHRAGFAVRPWVANGDLILAMLGLGVDAVFTDEPGLAVELRDRRHAGAGAAPARERPAEQEDRGSAESLVPGTTPLRVRRCHGTPGHRRLPGGRNR